MENDSTRSGWDDESSDKKVWDSLKLNNLKQFEINIKLEWMNGVIAETWRLSMGGGEIYTSFLSTS